MTNEKDSHVSPHLRWFSWKKLRQLTEFLEEKKPLFKCRYKHVTLKYFYLRWKFLGVRVSVTNHSFVSGYLEHLPTGPLLCFWHLQSLLRPSSRMNIFSSTFYYRKFQTYSKEKKFKVNTYIHNLSSPLIFDYICFTTLSILFERFVLNTSQIMCSFPWELLNTSSLLQCKSQPLEGSTRTQMISFDLHNGSLK